MNRYRFSMSLNIMPWLIWIERLWWSLRKKWMFMHICLQLFKGGMGYLKPSRMARSLGWSISHPTNCVISYKWGDPTARFRWTYWVRETTCSSSRLCADRWSFQIQIYKINPESITGWTWKHLDINRFLAQTLSAHSKLYKYTVGK